MSCSHIILDTLFIFVKSLHFFSLVIIRLKNGDEVGVITQFLSQMITSPSTCLTNTFSKERTVVDPRWRTTTITRTNTMKIHLVFRWYCWWDQKRFSNGNPDAKLQNYLLNQTKPGGPSCSIIASRSLKSFFLDCPLLCIDTPPLLCAYVVT